MRFAYADPPYLGNGWKNYYGRGHQASVYGKVESHVALIRQLDTGFPDGWAMSASSSSVRTLFPYMPDDVRLAVWHRPDGQPFPGLRARVIHSWEPVFYRSSSVREDIRARDCLKASCPRSGFPGAKPSEFVHWLALLLGAEPGDELVDIFPGSGAVGRAWQVFSAQRRLGLA